jgi:acyl-CoA thioesterase
MQTSEFDRATAVEPDGSGRYLGRVLPGWDISGNANGGYLLALASQAMRTEAGRAHPVTVTAHYLTPAPEGPAEVLTEVVKAGRRFATVTGSLRQDGVERIRVMGTFGDLSEPDEGGPELIRAAHPELPDFDQLSTRRAGLVAIEDRLDVRLHPDDARFDDGIKSGAPVLRGWFAFADGRPIDPLALLLVCDAFPPAVFNIDITPGWVPTIELTVHVRRVPVPGPLRCRFETRFITNGCFEEDGEVWDSAGRLVAQSRQLALTPKPAASSSPR